MKFTALPLSFILAFTLLSFAGAAAQNFPKELPRPDPAEAVPVPEKWQDKLWIIQSCEKGRLAHRFSNYFILRSTSAGSSLDRIGGLIDQNNGRYNMILPGEAVQLIEGTKGDLLQIFGNMTASFSAEDMENYRVIVPYIPFKSCEKTNDRIVENQDLVALMPKLDRLHIACPVPASIYKAECKRGIIAFFDENHDGLLDQDDLHKGWDFLLKHTTFGNCGAAASSTDALRREGLIYFEWLYENLDKNKDRKIAFEEIDGQWNRMQADPLMSGATNLLLSVQKTLKLLPQEIQITCLNCCISSAIP